MLTVDDTNDLIVEIQRLHSDQRLIQAARVLKKLRVGLEHTTKEQPENEDMCAIADYVNTASWAQVSHHATHRTPRSSTVQSAAQQPMSLGQVVEQDMQELSRYVDVFEEDEGCGSPSPMP